jgi:hypothetical protein
MFRNDYLKICIFLSEENKGMNDAWEYKKYT